MISGVRCQFPTWSFSYPLTPWHLIIAHMVLYVLSPFAVHSVSFPGSSLFHWNLSSSVLYGYEIHTTFLILVHPNRFLSYIASAYASNRADSCWGTNPTTQKHSWIAMARAVIQAILWSFSCHHHCHMFQWPLLTPAQWAADTDLTTLHDCH